MLDFLKRGFKPEVEGNADKSKKEDKKFYVIIIVFAVAIVLTVIRGFFDPDIAEQLHKLRFGVSDGVLLAAAAMGYYFLKRRGDK